MNLNLCFDVWLLDTVHLTVHFSFTECPLQFILRSEHILLVWKTHEQELNPVPSSPKLGVFSIKVTHSSTLDMLVDTLSIRTPEFLTLLILKFEQGHFITCQCICKLLDEWQTVWTLIRCCIMQHLIWVYTVCLGLSV